MTHIIIPESVTKIDLFAFHDCSGLLHVLYKGTALQWEKISIEIGNECLTGAVRHDSCTGQELVWKHKWMSTCITAGLFSLTCSVCDKTEEGNLPAQGHTYISKTAAPTCTQQGYTRHTCFRCNEVYEDGYVNATGHTWKYATCETAKTCDACGEEDGNALGHSYGDWAQVTAPTTEVAGLEERVCSGCGEKEQRELAKLDPVPELPDDKTHRDSDTVVIAAAMAAVGIVIGSAVMLSVLKKRR